MPEWSGYHVKSDGRAYFLPYTPKDLRDAIGPLPMVNLRMKASRSAERLALSHYIAHEALLEAKRQELREAGRKPRKVPLSEWAAESLADFALQLAQGFNRVQHAAIKHGNPRTELDDLQGLLSQVAGDVLSASGSEGLGNITALFLHANGTPFSREEPNFKALVFDFATALDVEFIKPGIRRLHGREAVAPPPFRTSSQQAPAVLTLGEVIDAYLKAKAVNKSGYTRKVMRCLVLFGEVLGAATPVASIRQLFVTQFLRSICQLPTDWAAQFDAGRMSVAEMLESASAEVMAPTTYNDNYRAPLKAFLRDARRDYGDEGFPVLIVDGIEYTGDREAGEDVQRALTVPELKKLFEGPGFAAIAAGGGSEMLYWLPVVALFTGARPRELCQLNPQCDWGEEGGIVYIDINAESAAGKGVNKTVKTGEARRIPLHPELERLGFPAYLKRLKEMGADRLFPASRVKKGNPFEVAGAHFTDFLKGEGLYDNAAPLGRQVLGVYVMRKSFITHARNQQVRSGELTGHHEDTTRVQRRHYITEPEPLVLKAKELRKLVLPIQVPLRGYR